MQSEQPILTVCEWLYSFAKAMGMFVVGEVVEVVVVWFIFALRLLNNIVIFCTDTVYLTKETYIMHSIPQNHSEKNALIDHADHITSITSCE